MSSSKSLSKKLLVTIIATFAVGSVVLLMGALFKLQHWAGASVLLTCGMIVQAVAMILITVYLVRMVLKPNRLTIK